MKKTLAVIALFIIGLVFNVNKNSSNHGTNLIEHVNADIPGASAAGASVAGSDSSSDGGGGDGP